MTTQERTGLGMIVGALVGCFALAIATKAAPALASSGVRAIFDAFGFAHLACGLTLAAGFALIAAARPGVAPLAGSAVGLILFSQLAPFAAVGRTDAFSLAFLVLGIAALLVSFLALSALSRLRGRPLHARFTAAMDTALAVRMVATFITNRLLATGDISHGVRALSALSLVWTFSSLVVYTVLLSVAAALLQAE